VLVSDYGGDDDVTNTLAQAGTYTVEVPGSDLGSNPEYPD
jgi:hypothetical protein